MNRQVGAQFENYPADPEAPVLGAPSPESSTPTPVAETSDGPQSAPKDPYAGNRVNAGGHSADVPAGWTVDDNRADEVALSVGDNRVIAYQFFAYEDDKADELIGPLTKRRLGSFKGSIRLDDYYDIEHNYQRASVGADGRVHGKKAIMGAWLWIAWDSGDALLVIQILTATSGSEIERESNTLVREFALKYP